MITAIRALWVREVVRFFRQKNRVIGAFMTPVLFWAIMGAGFDEFKFMFSGGLVMIVLFTGIFSAISVIQDRKEGFLQGVLVSPAPRVAIALGKIGTDVRSCRLGDIGGGRAQGSRIGANDHALWHALFLDVLNDEIRSQNSANDRLRLL